MLAPNTACSKTSGAASLQPRSSGWSTILSGIRQGGDRRRATTVLSLGLARPPGPSPTAEPVTGDRRGRPQRSGGAAPPIRRPDGCPCGRGEVGTAGGERQGPAPRRRPAGRAVTAGTRRTAGEGTHHGSKRIDHSYGAWRTTGLLGLIRRRVLNRTVAAEQIVGVALPAPPLHREGRRRRGR
jgi:hypothetical protein